VCGRSVPRGLFGMSAIPCRVWAFRNDRGLEAAELLLLDAEEKAQAARLKGKSDRDAFIKTRAAVRSIVGRETGVPPRDVAFRYNRWGKPYVDAPGRPSVDFSVSHTKGLSVVAVAHSGSVGVDDRIRIAADVFGLEVAQQLLAVDASRQDAVFLRLWTAGEAFIKARGSGLAGMNGKVPVRFENVGSERVVLRADFKDDWSLTTLELGDEFAGHVVVGGRKGARIQDSSIELRMAAGLGSR
jgi:4'-phosphopantetheinyl transferase